MDGWLLAKYAQIEAIKIEYDALRYRRDNSMGKFQFNEKHYSDKLNAIYKEILKDLKR